MKRGHYCWCCGRMRSNEKFSGKNHGKHLCKECSKIGQKDLKIRQAICNIDQIVRRNSGVISNKDKKLLEKFLTHSDEAVDYVKRVFAQDRELRLERERWLIDE